MAKTFTVTTCQADGTGTTEEHEMTPEMEELCAQTAEENLQGCKCPNPEAYPVYMSDGECDCGIDKHHWHCALCKCVVPIG